MLIDILRGSKAKKILPKFRKMKEYGQGIIHPAKWWKVFGIMMVIHEYMGEESIQFGHGCTVYVTDKGGDWLKEKDKLFLHAPKDMYEKSIKIQTISKTEVKVSSETIDITYDMYHNQNMTIDEIAKKRKYKTRTIEDHIIKAYSDNKDLDMNKLKLTDNVYNTIKNKINELGINTRLRSIKNSLPNNISYFQIRITKVKMENRNQHNIIIEEDIDNSDSDSGLSGSDSGLSGSDSDNKSRKKTKIKRKIIDSDSDSSNSDDSDSGLSDSDSDNDNSDNIKDIMDIYFRTHLRKKRKKEKKSDKFDIIYKDYKAWLMYAIDKNTLKQYIKSKGYKYQNNKMLGLKLVSK